MLKAHPAELLPEHNINSNAAEARIRKGGTPCEATNMERLTLHRLNWTIVAF